MSFVELGGYANHGKLLKKSLVLADRFLPGCFFGRCSRGQAFPSRPSGGFDLAPVEVLDQSLEVLGGGGHEELLGGVPQAA